jgi:release factor glutamine methyltransferase
MLTYHAAFYGLKDELSPIYGIGEAAAIAHEVLLHLTGKDKTERLLNKEKKLSPGEQQEYDIMKAALLEGKPLQYVTGIAWFMGEPYMVNKYVLIPRPETEELVQWIAEENGSRNIKVLDIGTGSGCIPIALKRMLPHAAISSCDISNEALVVAGKNAENLNATIQLMQLDILDEQQRERLDKYDIIVSNPPYIPINEKEQLDINVREYEPDIALFVPDSDPLLFYRAIAVLGRSHLNNGGSIYCELHQDLAIQTQALFEEAGYKEVRLKEDMHGNMRMLKANK